MTLAPEYRVSLNTGPGGPGHAEASMESHALYYYVQKGNASAPGSLRVFKCFYPM